MMGREACLECVDHHVRVQPFTLGEGDGGLAVLVDDAGHGRGAFD